MWDAIRSEGKRYIEKEPLLASFIYETILNHESFTDALGFHLSNKLESPNLKALILRELITKAFKNEEIISSAVRDLEAIQERDPAARSLTIPFLFYKGFHALQCYRVAHSLWTSDRKILALFLQNRISEVFAADIHPAAQIGSGVFIDHATAVVIGETAVVENNVSILHEVTLGGTGKEEGDRHPKIREGVLIGAGAKILGNIEIGRGAKIGAGSVVLKSVPAHVTVAGVPAKFMGKTEVDSPAMAMDHLLAMNGKEYSYDFQI